MELKPQPQLFDAKTGEAIHVDPSQVPQLVASGAAAFKRGEIIPAIDKDGNSVGIPAEDAHNAFKQGFTYEPLASQEHRALKEEYGEGAGNAVKAGAEGVARGLSLGLSDVALKGMGADMEAVKARKEFNPVTSTLSEVTGAVAPIILSGGAAAPVEGAVEAGAVGAAKAAAKYAPSALAAEAGTAVTEAVANKVGAGGASLASRIAKGAIPMGAGSAVEGAIYGAGNTVSEAALGDPDLTAEKALANIGLTAALGGALGGIVGGAFAAAGKGLNHAEFVSELHDGQEVGARESMDIALNSPLIKPEEREGIIDGLTKKKANAAEIEEAANILGVPVLESQVSKSKAVQSADSILLHDANVSPIAISRKNILAKGMEKVESAVDSSLGAESGMSKVDVGNAVKQSLSDKFEAQYAPIKSMYDELKKNYEFIPVSERAKSQIIANIKKIDNYKFSGSLERKLGDELIENMGNIKTVDDLKSYATLLRGKVNQTVPGERYAAEKLVEKLKNLEDNSVIRAAEQFAKESNDPAAKKAMLDILETRKAANAGYKALLDDMGEVANTLGKRRVHGPSDFIQFLDDLTPEKVTQKLFTKGNSEFLNFFQKKFPEEMQLLIQYQKNAIRDAAVKDGVLNVNRAIKEIDKLEPEVQKVMFHPEELKKINAARVWMESLPKNINPSGTAFTEAAMGFFDSPVKATLQTIRDYGIEKFIKSAAGRGADGPTIRTLLKLEEMSQKATRDINSSVKGFLGKAGAAGTYVAVKAFKPDIQETPEDRRKFFQKQSKEVISAASNPEHLIEKTSDAYAGLTKVAPKVAQAMSSKSAQAAIFLYDKMPKNPFGSDQLFSNKKWSPSDFEISKWKRYVDTVDNPMSAIKDLKSGKMNIEQVEALKNVYPELYGEVQSKIMEELPKLKEELPYAKRLQLGILFQVPADPSLKPQFIQQMQTLHAISAQAHPQGQGGGIPSGKRTEHLDFAAKSMSGTERVINRV